MLDPSNDNARGPFERVASPEEAVDRLVRLYDEATEALHGAVERFLKEGEPPSSATRALFRYPELRLIYAPTGPALSSPRAFAKFSEPGVYATTVTQPAEFRAYLLEQLEPLVSEYGAAIEVGVGAQEIPYPYVIESGDELTSGGGADPAELARFFPVPSLATIGDETADGEFDFGPERPLALFDAPRVDYSLRRLVHYTGSDWRAMQPWVLLTNYHRYVDQFVQWGLKQLHAGTGVEKVILPGNVVIDSSIPPAEAEARAAAVAWHRFQMPAYHCVRADGRGISLVNIGVGPSNAKTITDHIAVLRPHCWLMIGHCAGLRQSQVIGDYVLAHAYLRRDNILDEAAPLMVPIPALAEVQVALQEAVAKVTGDRGEALEAAPAHRHRRHQRRSQLGIALVAGAAAHQRFARHRRRHGIQRPSPPRASACACLTARCSASPTSRCMARSSCPARPTPSTSGRSPSICRSASPRSGICRATTPRCTRASSGASTSRRSGEDLECDAIEPN